MKFDGGMTKNLLQQMYDTNPRKKKIAKHYTYICTMI